jgi:hypothetical protein|nr:RagB/SusD family nutrient uptake outer membrane protein [Prevotella sp.]
MTKIKYLISGILMTIFCGCTSDLLDRSPLDTLSPGTFYENETQCKMGLMGVYASIPPTETVAFWYQLDFMSDNNYCQDSWQGSKEFGEWAQNASSWGPSAKWKQDYQTIVRANTFIANLSAANVSDDVKKQMNAEARYLRAYAYFDLITYFGDVPLIMGTQTLDSAKVTRTEKDKVQAAILGDLDAAASALPNSYAGSNIGRVTKGAALTLKCKTLLYNQKWADAATAAKEVMDMGVYKLYPDYAGLFDEANENNVEVIFDIQYIKNSQNQSWPSARLSFVDWPTPNVTSSIIDSYYMTNGLPITDTKSGYKDQDPYTNRDPRMAASIVLPGSKTASGTFIPANDQVPCGARPRKYADINGTDSYNYSLNTIVLRYADVLLMRAEALIESGNTGQEVYDLIDQVRARVNMPKIENVEGTGLNQDQLRNILRHERRVEFFMEGTRYADMLRWKDESLVHDVYGYVTSKLSDPTNPSKWVFETEKKETRKFDSTKGWLWPIPQVEMQNNSNLKQNPGY